MNVSSQILSKQSFHLPSEICNQQPSFSRATQKIFKECGFQTPKEIANPLNNRLKSLDCLFEKLKQSESHIMNDRISCVLRSAISVALIAGIVLAITMGTEGVALGVSISLGISAFILALCSASLAGINIPYMGAGGGLLIFAGPFFPIYEMSYKIHNIKKEIENEEKGLQRYAQEMKTFCQMIDKNKLLNLLKEKNQELDSIQCIQALPEGTRQEILETKENYKTALEEFSYAAKYY